MKLDRTSFLALAAAIATTSCIVTVGSPDDDDGAGATGAGTTTTPEGGGGATTTPDGGSGGIAQGGSGGAEPCDDSVGESPDCTPVGDSTCGEFAVTACVGAETYYKPAVAQAAAECILAADLTDCQPAYDCRNAALAAACADATADELCLQIVDACVGAGFSVDMATCHGYVDGLNEDGRALMATECVDNGCAYGINSCAEGIL